MSDTLRRVLVLNDQGDLLISAHGYDELATNSISVKEVLAGLREAVMVEDYPDFAKGPSVLVLQRDADGRPIHVVWGIPKGRTSPAILVAAYRPDPARWLNDFMRRK